MCGIAGQFSTTPDLQARPRAELLLQALRHRGPDDEGSYCAADGRAMMIHTRLAILDLSAAGHQPMGTEGGRREAVPLTIVFNGEIYNFRELRVELEAEGWEFRTGTDTEVILALYAREGPGCVARLRGMFAFAIWDEGLGTAFLARDPLGIKPLYVCEDQGRLAFASELRALMQADLCGGGIDPEALWSFFRYGAVVEPRTMIQGVRMLPAGHAMEWKEGVVRTWEYWKPEIPASAAAPKATAQARAALLGSVRAHLVSDAPVGVFLSGGMDSTAMAALAQEAGIGELRTFSIGFAEAAFDESTPARRTAEALGARHHEWIMTAEEGRRLLRGFVEALDQPTIDGLNTYCVSKFAHDGGCKVVLSGLGGDEIMGGYASFHRVPKLLKLHRWLGWAPGARWLASRWLGASRSPVRRRVGEYLAGDGSALAAYEACRSLFTRAEASALVEHLLGKVPTGVSASGPALPAAPEDAVSIMEMTRYMRNQLLRDSDVMSMRWGLELRVPMVDRDVFAALVQIPHAQRLAAGKQLLADAVPELPEWVRNQPKRGFSFPFSQWMDGDWLEMMEASGRGCPVPLQNWYQRWAVFIFQEWRKLKADAECKGLTKLKTEGEEKRNSPSRGLVS